MPSEASPFQSLIEQLTVDTMDATRIGDAAASTWRRIDDALWPIIGRAGVAALFKRSLYLARAKHPCFAVMYDATATPNEFALLRETLAQQPRAEAAAAHDGLLAIFLDLLSNLIGESLTRRLLRSVWAQPSSGYNLSSGDAVQDTSP